jgi:hypothetical protein
MRMVVEIITNETSTIEEEGEEAVRLHMIRP